jgi:D-aspartate ligase
MPEIIPVLLGADLNCYSVARAFHEAYGVVSHAFGRWPMGETRHSRIVRFTAVQDLDTDAVMLKTLGAFAKAHPNAQKIVLGCTDDYAAMLIRHRAALGAQYTVPYISAALMERLVSKESFYTLCDEFGIPYPATVVLRGAADTEKLQRLPFGYPVILKPSSSISYWKHEFEGMKKVYLAETPGEAAVIVRTVYAGGYPNSLIIQEKIPGPDDGMRVFTAYANRNGKVKMACLGHVLLEEHTPRALGNHAAILTEYHRPLMDTLANFLEAIGYTGYANFDIKYDPRDGRYKVFEVNLRQGRSNYYVTGAGLNIARYLVEDHLLQNDLGAPVFFNRESYWHSIPNKIVWEYTADSAAASRAKAIVKAGGDTTALGYPYDLRGNFPRCLYLWVHNRRYHKKYAAYCDKPAKPRDA